MIYQVGPVEQMSISVVNAKKLKAAKQQQQNICKLLLLLLHYLLVHSPFVAFKSTHSRFIGLVDDCCSQEGKNHADIAVPQRGYELPSDSSWLWLGDCMANNAVFLAWVKGRPYGYILYVYMGY